MEDENYFLRDDEIGLTGAGHSGVRVIGVPEGMEVTTDSLRQHLDASFASAQTTSNRLLEIEAFLEILENERSNWGEYDVPDFGLKRELFITEAQDGGWLVFFAALGDDGELILDLKEHTDTHEISRAENEALLILLESPRPKKYYKQRINLNIADVKSINWTILYHSILVANLDDPNFTEKELIKFSQLIARYQKRCEEFDSSSIEEYSISRPKIYDLVSCDEDGDYYLSILRAV